MPNGMATLFDGFEQRVLYAKATAVVLRLRVAVAIPGIVFRALALATLLLDPRGYDPVRVRQTLRDVNLRWWLRSGRDSDLDR